VKVARLSAAKQGHIALKPVIDKYLSIIFQLVIGSVVFVDSEKEVVVTTTVLDI
jgi:hypothetical protein